MHTNTDAFDNVTTKLIAAGVIAVCLLLGVAGLILPLLPGLLFLGVAAIVAAKLSPRFAELLRRNETLRGYLDRTQGIGTLPLEEKLKLVGLLSLKALIDGVAFLIAGVMRLMKAAERT
jgi:uncharacterized membrane protein YbaN (DUF454 family)